MNDFKKKSVFAVSVAIVLLLILSLALCVKPVSALASSDIVEWGLTPNNKEITPAPHPKGKELLDKYGGCFVADTTQKEVFLTFDLGYEAGYTDEVLDILKKYNIKAVFFLCGHYLKEVDLIKRILDEGHEIGNHTDKHKDLPTLSDDLIKKDIVDFDIKYKEMFPNSSDLRFFRPPKGKFCERTSRIIKEQNLKNMMWSIAIADWGKTPIDAVKCSNTISNRIHNGAIILLHITNSGTVDMLNRLIPLLQEKGYSVGDATTL